MAQLPPETSNQPKLVYLQRCRCDPRWAATEIHNLHRALSLIIQQVDMPENDDRTIKTFRGGTLIERAKEIVKATESGKQT